MKKSLSLFALVGLVCLLAWTAVAPPAGAGESTATGGADKEKKNVLFLNSYQPGYAWSDDIHKGLQATFKESDQPVDLQVEYMDSKKFTDPTIKRMLHDYYKYKFRHTNFDSVVVSDNFAFDFIREFGDELFPGLPVVFCGVNDFHDEMLAGKPGFTGVLENPDIEENLEIAITLHPDKSRVIVIGDQSITGVAIANQVKAVKDRFDGRLAFEFWDEYNLDEILERARTIPPDALIFLIPFYKDSSRHVYSVNEVLEAISRSTDAPIYSAWEFMLGHGMVGGRLHSGVEEGRLAAGMTLRILAGEPVASIPIIRTTLDKYIFDYRVLTRHAIAQSLLPEGFSLINEPYSFYKINAQLLWTIVVGFLFLLFILVLLATSIIQKKSVEEKIKDQLSFLKSLMDNIPQLVFWKDKDLRYLGVNKPFLSFFGFADTAEVIGRTDFELMDEAFARSIEERDRRLLAAGEPQHRVEWTVDNGLGEPARLEINTVPLHDDRGRIVGALSTAEDITDRVSLEKQLLQSQKMEAIGTLAGGIAHDFNNILTSIINSTELALLDVDRESPTSVDLERVLKAGQRGSRLVKQILAFSRPSQEGFLPTDVAAVLREAHSLIQASLPRNIEILHRVDAVGAVCMADGTQLHQIVMNLCTNSFQALRDRGGWIEIGLSGKKLDEAGAEMLNVPPGRYLKLTIADSGPGILPDIVDKIFDPFFTTKGQGEGTGLGLAVVHGIVKAHKGAIAVSSAPWERTAFDIYLPTYHEADAGGIAGPEACHLGEGSILFVEDDEDQLQTIPRILSQLGYRIEAVGGAAEAIGTLARTAGEGQTGFDLVITDFDMPGTNGLELARRVAEIAPGVPVIVVSGRRVEVGPDDMGPTGNIRKVVSKPYDKVIISAAIREVLDEKAKGRKDERTD